MTQKIPEKGFKAAPRRTNSFETNGKTESLSKKIEDRKRKFLELKNTIIRGVEEIE